MQIDKLLWTLKNLNIFSKNLNINSFPTDIKQLFDQVLKQVLQITNQYIKIKEISDQFFLYMQKCITLLGADSLDYVNELGQFYIKVIELERLEPLIGVLSFTVTTLKYESHSMVKLMLPLLSERLSQVQCPTSNTSDVDKVTLSCFSAFMRFAYLCFESFDYYSIETVPAHFTTWLL